MISPTKTAFSSQTKSWISSGSWTADVVVLGGGPAGTAAALALTRAGRSVVVLERSRYDSVRFGETLPPEIRLPLSELGVWEQFLGDGPMPSPGITFAWGGPEPRNNDFLFNPFGSGWHIDRRQFDATLATAAEARGAKVVRGAQLVAWDQAPSGVWLLQGVADERTFDLRAHVLIDATGRAPSPVRRLGGGRVIHDRLAGLVGFVKVTSEVDQRTLVESTEKGWWYSALLPGGPQVAAFMTDADLLPRRGKQRVAFWHNQLSVAPLSRARLSRGALENDPRIVAASCSRMRRIAGMGWLAAGDAAAALDPLSSQGVYRALLSGLAAAKAVDDYLRNTPEALADYAREVEANFATDLKDWADYYGRERRWQDAPFWQRRQSSAVKGKS